MVNVELCRPVSSDEGLEVVAQLVVREGEIEQLDGVLAHLIDLDMPVMGISEGKPPLQR